MYDSIYWSMYALKRISTVQTHQPSLCARTSIPYLLSLCQGLSFAKFFVRCWQLNILVWSNVCGNLQGD
jgi:hypothetical protein